MSALAITVNVSGLAGIEAKLARLDPLDQEKLLTGLARLIREQTRDRLRRGGPAPSGAAWKPNKEGRSPILHRTGALARSIDYAVRGSRAIVGSGLVYTALHQFGGVIVPKTKQRLAFRIGNMLVFAKKVTMPARPYIGLSAPDREEVTLAAVRHIRGRLG